MGDPGRIAQRLKLLAELLSRLDATRQAGLEAYLRDRVVRGDTERSLQIAEQVCIDVGASLISELNVRAANDYAEVFTRLSQVGIIDASLAARLGDAARQRNLLVHMYMEVDDRKVFDTLEHLEDLRQFASAVLGQLDSEP